jgi:hypothetical protein
MKSIRTLLAILVVSGIAFTSCDDLLEPMAVSPEDSQELKDDAIQNSKADDAFGGTLEAISTYGISEDWTKKFDGNGPVVTYDPIEFVVTLTFTNGGTIIIDWNAAPWWTTPNLTGVVTITNFVENGSTTNGTLNIASVGTETQPALSVEGTLTMLIGTQTMTFTINRTFIWHAGFNTPDNLLDDAFAIHGTSTLVTGNKTLTTTVLENEKMIKYNSCDYPQQGIIKMVVSGQNKSVTMDYGVDVDGLSNNACDAYVKFTIKVGNASITIIGTLN